MYKSIKYFFCNYRKSYKEGTLVEYEKNPIIPLYFSYSDKSFPNNPDFNNFLKKYQLDFYNSLPTTFVIKAGSLIDYAEGDITLSSLTNLINRNL